MITVTTPFWSTVAMVGSLELHITFLLVALDGAMVSISCSEFGFVELAYEGPQRFVVVLLSVTPVTLTALTYRVHCAENPPSLVVAVRMVVPVDRVVTDPVELIIVATKLLLEVQVMDLSLAFAGSTVAATASPMVVVFDGR